MPRVGLTGGLGSGKTTVAGMFHSLGAAVISADQLGRQLMEPGEPVYSAIVAAFGSEVVRADGALDRRVLAERAFQHNQSDVLNRIVHPAVVAAEGRWMDDVFAVDPGRVAIVESALIFEVERWGTAPGWVERFDKLILVTVPDVTKIERFVARMKAQAGNVGTEALTLDARARLAAQLPDSEKATRCHYVIENSGSLQYTRQRVEAIYRELTEYGQNPKVP